MTILEKLFRLLLNNVFLEGETVLYLTLIFRQGATSHHLGQNFSKMFDIVFEDPNNPVRYIIISLFLMQRLTVELPHLLKLFVYITYCEKMFPSHLATRKCPTTKHF